MLKDPNARNRCPFCGMTGSHTAQCNASVQSTGQEILEQQEREKQKKKKFSNTRIYKSALEDKANFEKLKK